MVWVSCPTPLCFAPHPHPHPQFLLSATFCALFCTLPTESQPDPWATCSKESRLCQLRHRLFLCLNSRLCQLSHRLSLSPNVGPASATLCGVYPHEASPCRFGKGHLDSLASWKMHQLVHNGRPSRTVKAPLPLHQHLLRFGLFSWKSCTSTKTPRPSPSLRF